MHNSSTKWFNSFLFSDFKYLMAYSIPFSALIGFYFEGYYLFITPLYIFIIIPFIEIILTFFKIDEIETARQNKSVHWIFDIMLYLNIPLVFGLLIYALTKVINYEFRYH